MPLMFIVFGDMTDSFVSLGKYGNCFKLPQPNDGDPIFNDVYYPGLMVLSHLKLFKNL